MELFSKENEIEFNGYSPNADVSSLATPGIEVNNSTVPIPNSNIFDREGGSTLGSKDFKSRNFLSDTTGWFLGADGTWQFNPNPANSRCRVYLNADATITAGGARKILFDRTTYDNLGEFDITTNNRFVAINAGNYLVNAICKFDPSAADVFYTLLIQRNGVTVAQKDIYSLTAGTFAIQVTDIVALTAGQYIEIFVDSAEGSDYTAKGTTTRTFLDIHRLS
jgi:hypothetical protein